MKDPIPGLATTEFLKTMSCLVLEVASRTSKFNSWESIVEAATAFSTRSDKELVEAFLDTYMNMACNRWWGQSNVRLQRSNYHELALIEKTLGIQFPSNYQGSSKSCYGIEADYFEHNLALTFTRRQLFGHYKRPLESKDISTSGERPGLRESSRLHESLRSEESSGSTESSRYPPSQGSSTGRQSAMTANSSSGSSSMASFRRTAIRAAHHSSTPYSSIRLDTNSAGASDEMDKLSDSVSQMGISSNSSYSNYVPYGGNAYMWGFGIF